VVPGEPGRLEALVEELGEFTGWALKRPVALTRQDRLADLEAGLAEPRVAGDAQLEEQIAGTFTQAQVVDEDLVVVAVVKGEVLRASLAQEREELLLAGGEAVVQRPP